MEKIEKRSNKTMQFILLGCYLILTISGLVLMKKGGNPGSLAIENGNFNFGISLVIASVTWIGISLISGLAFYLSSK